MHIPYWLSILPAEIVHDMALWYKRCLKCSVNKRRTINRLKQDNRHLKSILVKYGMLQLATQTPNDDDDEYVDNINPMSPDVIRTRANQMVDLLMTQDARISIGQQFIQKILSILYKKNENVQQCFREKVTPLIVRDINASIQAYRNDPDRIIREAFSIKHINLSHNKSRTTRKHVCFIFVQIFINMIFMLFCCFNIQVILMIIFCDVDVGVGVGFGVSVGVSAHVGV